MRSYAAKENRKEIIWMSRIKIKKHRGWYPRIKKAATLREQSGTYNNATRVDMQCQRPVRPDLTDLLQISREQLGTSGQYLSTVLAGPLVCSCGHENQIN